MESSHRTAACIRALAVICLMVAAIGSGTEPLRAQSRTTSLPVLPAPVAVTMQAGECVIFRGTPVFADPLFQHAAQSLAELISSAAPTPFEHRVVPSIRFVLAPPGITGEAYHLRISAEGIVIRAGTDAGAYYAVQTLRQLLPSCIEGGSRFRAWRIPCMTISDCPRFSWRGVSLDCSRHFLPVPEIKQIIDRMAALKMNRLHWHLTDDQGWRLEIRAYPELTRVGAWRGEGSTRYGGYYSQQDVRDLVAYAMARHVVIVPELDMPGHATAALASYPWLGCRAETEAVAETWGIFETVLCPGRETTYEFIETVLREVVDLFPSPWIHVGGDECRRERWWSCDSCHASQRRNRLLDVNYMQSYFTGRVESMLARLGRTPIGWNEIAEGASKSTIVQAWYHVEVGIEMSQQGFQVICSPIEPYYLNYHHDYNTLEKVYSFDPIIGHPWPDGGKSVLGIECCLWTESLPTPVEVNRMLFPRIAAVAEAAWSEAQRKDWDSFRLRLGVLGGRWRQQGQDFLPLDEVLWDNGEPLTMKSVDRPMLDDGVPFQDATRFVLSGLSEGRPAVANPNASAFPVSSMPPVVARFDSTEVAIDYAYTHPELIDGYTVRGMHKKMNPWAELIDSLSLDGLCHLSRAEKGRTSPRMELFPNPLSPTGQTAEFRVRLTIDELGPVEVSVYDLRGERVRSILVQALPFGTWTIPVTIENFAAGSYMVVTRAAAHTGATMLHVLPSQ